MYLLQGYWHIVALSIITASLTIHYETTIFLIGYMIWLIFLYMYKKYPVALLITSSICCFFFLSYIPKIEDGQHIEKTEQEINGHIVSKVEETTKTIQFTLRADDGDIAAIYFKRDDEEEQYPFLHSIQYNASCSIRGNISSPKIATNPFEFNYKQFLAKKGIDRQLLIDNPEQILCEQQRSVLQTVYHMRSTILKKIEAVYTETTAAWMKALLFGDTSAVDEDVIDTFQRWGLSHILAISGLHVGIIVVILYTLFVRFQLTTKENAHWIIFCFLPVYIFLAGSEPSVWRASMMIIMMTILQRYRLQIHYGDMISIVFILLLCMNPYFIYSIGFQFSFAVAFSIILSRILLQQTNSKLIQALQISFIAQMVILPLQINYFSIFQPLSIILNIIVIPYFTIVVMPFLFISFIGLYVPTTLFSVFDTLFVKVHESILHLLQWIDLQFSYPLFIGQMSLIVIVLYYILFFFMMRYIELNTYKRALISSMLFIGFIIFLSIRPFMNPYGTVTMLDIGQGDAFVIELPYRQGVFIVDAGATFAFENMEPTKTVYQNIIRPFLYGKGIYTIDAIFISHEHVDHEGSVPYILGQFPVDEVVVSEFFKVEESSLRDLDIVLKRVRAGELYKYGSFTWQIVAPFTDKQDANENSLGLYANFAGVKWLFTGDMYQANELTLLEHYPSLNIDVLKIGHHGSKTSTGEEFLRKTQPKVAFIPVGKNNRYNHPAEEVVDRIEAQNMQVFRTDEDGAVTFTFKEGDTYFEMFLTK